jgi:hypothetical protein
MREKPQIRKFETQQERGVSSIFIVTTQNQKYPIRQFCERDKMVKLDSMINLSVFSMTLYYFHSLNLLNVEEFNLQVGTLVFLFFCVFVDFANGTFSFLNFSPHNLSL